MPQHIVYGYKPFTAVELAFAKAKHLKDGPPTLDNVSPSEDRIFMRGHWRVRQCKLASQAGIDPNVFSQRVKMLGTVSSIAPPYPIGRFHREDQIQANWKYLSRPLNQGKGGWRRGGR